MTIQEMHYEVRLLKDSIDAASRAGLETWEIDSYLNRAIWVFLKQRYGYDFESRRGFETDQARITQLSNLHIKSPELQPAIVPTYIGDGRYELRLNDLGKNINGQYFRYLFLTDGYIVAKKGNCTKKIPISQWRLDQLKTSLNDSSWLWRRILVNFGRSTFINSHVLPVGSTQDADTTANLDNNRLNIDELSSLYFDCTNKFDVQEFDIVEVCLSYLKYPNRVFFGGYDHVDKLSNVNTPPIHCDIDEAFHNEIVNIAVGLIREDLQDQLGIQVSTNRVSLDMHA